MPKKYYNRKGMMYGGNIRKPYHLGGTTQTTMSTKPKKSTSTKPKQFGMPVPAPMMGAMNGNPTF